jgi:hypothetical protein
MTGILVDQIFERLTPTESVKVPNEAFYRALAPQRNLVSAMRREEQIVQPVKRVT